MTKKKLYNLCFILDLIFLLSCLFVKELFSSNLSRLFNRNIYTYLFINLFSISYGYCLYYAADKLYSRISFLAFIAPIIGSIIRYNPAFPNALSSNIHLLSAYISVILIGLIELLILRYFILNLKLRNFLRNVYIIIFGICLYLYIDQMFVSLFSEILFLMVILLINYILINYEVKNGKSTSNRCGKIRD